MAHRVAAAALMLLTAASFSAGAQPVTVAVIPTTRGEIVVDPNPVEIRGPRVVRFELQGSGFSFPDRTPGGQRGIHIDGEVMSATDMRPKGPGASQNEVGPCERVENGRAMNCPNRNSRPGFYKYTVNVVGPNGQPLAPRDPVIVNR